MRYRELGTTGLLVSEIGFGAEWMDKPAEEVKEFVACCQDAGINIMDIWMADPSMREKLGCAMEELGSRASWIIQGHIGSTWQEGQYVRTRDVDKCKEAFEDLLRRLRTDHVELGMIHYVDDPREFAELVTESAYMDYVLELKEAGTVQHVGLSTHNPDVALAALECEHIEVIMFSINPAFDMMPASDDIDTLFGDFSQANDEGIDPSRALLYRRAAERGVGITAMKPFAGGRLLDAEKSPFGVALEATQCIHYCLTRPAVASVLAGVSELSHIDAAVSYEMASKAKLDYAPVLAKAPRHAYRGNCLYCGHCQPCVVEIDIATTTKFLDLATAHEEVPASVQAHYDALAVKASSCIACRLCEPRCPFGVKISENMKRAAEVLG